MARRDELTHTQKAANNATPSKRVLLKGGKDFELVGENILYSTPQKLPLSKKEVTALATEMFESWKNSPSHSVRPSLISIIINKNRETYTPHIG